MPKRKWILGFLISLGLSLLISVVMTYQDWSFNPNGIFHNPASGTHWPFVWETFFSWFFPLLVILAAVVSMVLLILYRIRRKP